MTILSGSQVYRFRDENTSNISARTGQLTLNIPVAAINGNYGMGPSIELSLSCSLLNAADTPYGWRFDDTLSKYDRVQNKLYLSDGRVFSLVKNRYSGALSFYKPGPVDCILKTGSDNRVQVVHKNGTIEVFESLSRADDILAVERVISPEGFSLYLEWGHRAGRPFILSIRDESRTLLTTETNNCQRVKTFNNLADNTVRRLFFKNNRLETVRLSERPQAWQLQYAKYSRPFAAPYNYLSGYTNPEGLKTRILMAFPGLLCPVRPCSDNSNNNTLYAYNVRSLPVVRRLEVLQKIAAPSGEQAIIDKTTTEYAYSLRNFMGYGAKTTPVPQGADLTVYAVNDYEYSTSSRLSLCRYDCAQKKVVPFYLIKRDLTNNKFHCLVSQLETFTDALRSDDAVRSDYAWTQTLQQFVSGADLSRPFSEQVLYYAQPTSSKTTWSGVSDNGATKSRTEIITFAYDDVGNLTTKIYPDGSLESLTWYPATGEGDLCPADPHGFIRFVKSQSLTPAPSDYEAPVRRSISTWQAFDTRPAAAGVVNTFIALSGDTLAELTTTSPDTLVYYTKTLREYDITDSGSPFYSALKSGTLEAADNSVTSTVWKNISTTSYTRTLSADSSTVDITTRQTTADNLSLSDTEIFDAFSFRLLESVDTRGNTITYVYGTTPDNPYLLSTTVNAGTEYENTTSYLREFGPDPASGLTSDQYRLSTTDAVGNINRDTYDAAGNVTKREYARAPAEGELPAWFTTATTLYISGLLQQSREYDYRQEDSTLLAEITNFYRYTDWMQMSQIASSTGTTAESYYNAAANTIYTCTLQNEYSELSYDAVNPVTSGSYLSRMDIAGNVISLVRYTAADTPPKVSDTPISEVLYTYDGLNRLRAVTDEYKNTTAYTLDFFDRVVSVTHPDYSIIRYDYQSLHMSPVKVTVQASATATGVVTGERTLDGLGRIVSAAIGGRQYGYAFDSASQSQPSIITQPDGSKLGMTYDPHLGDVVLTVNDVTDTVTPKTLKTFTYNKKYGWPNDRTDWLSSLREEFTWNLQGQLIRNTLRAGTDAAGTEKITNDLEHSLGGMLTGATVSSGGVKITQRAWGLDSRGRPQIFSDTILQSMLSYDALNQVNTLTTESQVDSDSIDSVKASYDFDDFGRPLSTTYTQGSTETEVMTLNCDYDLKDRVVSKTIRYTSQSLTLKSEYHYDSLGRLKQSDDKTAGTETHWEYDSLNNVTNQVVYDTASSALIDSLTYTFTSPDPCQLTGVQNDMTTQVTMMKYNACGCLTENGLNMTEYDILNRAIRINGEQCLYDADDQRRGNTMLFNYIENNITENVSDDFINNETAYIYSKVNNVSQGVHIMIYGERISSVRELTDEQSSVITNIDDNNNLSPLFYTSWGCFDHSTKALNNTPAFKGMIPSEFVPDDTNDITYPLKYGPRNYLPGLMRFNKPDYKSPFDLRMVNSYAYCDPIYFHFP